MESLSSSMTSSSVHHSLVQSSKLLYVGAANTPPKFVRISAASTNPAAEGPQGKPQQQPPSKVNGSSSSSSSKVNGTSSSVLVSTSPLSISSMLSQKAAAVFSVASETSYALSGAVLSAIAGVAHQIPLEKTELHEDALKQGRLVERVVYRQTFVIRSYEVGADKTATLETFLNLFQETALNHVLTSGLAGDGFGTTHEMIRNSLIWVVTRMQVEVERYPAWGNALEIDTWVGASGKNGMRRDWLVRDFKTGSILARATSTWVMMHKNTRRLSKMPDTVRAEISPWFLTRTAFVGETTKKIEKLDDAAQFIRTGLAPRHSDLDMNQHVNNVKYISWMMESLPPQVFESHQLVGITLEYRKECGKSDIVQSLTKRETEELSTVNGSASVNGSSPSGINFTHLLRKQTDGSEIVRSRTTWKSRL